MAGCPTKVRTMGQSPASHLPFGGSAFAERTVAISCSPGAGWLPGKPLRKQPLGPHRKYIQILADAAERNAQCVLP